MIYLFRKLNILLFFNSLSLQSLPIILNRLITLLSLLRLYTYVDKTLFFFQMRVDLKLLFSRLIDNKLPNRVLRNKLNFYSRNFRIGKYWPCT